MYADTITMFCRYTSNNALYWKAIALSGVDLNVDKSAILAKYGANCKDTAKLHIRYKAGVSNDIIVSNGTAISYVEPKSYSGASNTVTFRDAEDGETPDFFIVGAWSGSDTISDNSYTDGFYNYANRTQNCYAIDSVAKYSVIPHFEIMAG